MISEGSASFSPDLVERWGIRRFEAIADTHTSLVHRVLRRDGSSAITKQLKTTGLHELPGMDFLRWREGDGAVRLLDQCGMICLLEDAGGITLRAYWLEEGEDKASAVIVCLLHKLHSSSNIAYPDDLQPLRQHFGSLFQRAIKDDGDPLTQALAYCAEMAKDLLSAQTGIRPLHGDLHHENIISADRQSWLAIDPQGLIGDPAYEVANVFGNPDGAFSDIIDPVRIVTLARLFSATTGCSAEKILRYAIAHAGLSICWSLEKGDSLSAGGNASERFAFFGVARRLLEAGAVSD